MGPQSVVTPSPLRSTRARWLAAGAPGGHLARRPASRTRAGRLRRRPCPGAFFVQPEPQSPGPGPVPGEQGAAHSRVSRALIKELGPEGAVPDKVVFEFAHSVAVPGLRGQEGHRHPVLARGGRQPGVLRQQLRALLHPGQRLQLGTTYTVHLESVEHRPAGVVKAPSAEAWSYSFTTPKLAFLQMAAGAGGRLQGPGDRGARLLRAGGCRHRAQVRELPGRGQAPLGREADHPRHPAQRRSSRSSPARRSGRAPPCSSPSSRG